MGVGGWLLNISGKENNRFAKLEVMLNVDIIIADRLPMHLDDELIERVVVAFTHTQWKPSVTTLDNSLQSHGFGLSAKGFFLREVLYLEQHALSLEFENG